MSSKRELKTGVRFKGKIEGEITKELVLPAPDKPNHLLGLAESKGKNRSQSDPPFLEGAEVKAVEEWDLQDGEGPDHGYFEFKVGADAVIVRYVGTAKPEEKDKYLLAGRMNFVSGSGRFLGISGSARYSGFVLSSRYELTWQGRYILPG